MTGKKPGMVLLIFKKETDRRYLEVYAVVAKYSYIEHPIKEGES